MTGRKATTANQSLVTEGCGLSAIADVLQPLTYKRRGMKKTISLMSFALLAGCVSMPQQQQTQLVRINSEFDIAAAAEQMKKGDAKISGSAFMRQRGGGVVTCAGSEVRLLPVTAYATERFNHLYAGAPQVGAIKIASVYSQRNRAQFTPDSNLYQQYMHKTACDAQGNFEFKNVKHGPYYITVGVTWQAGNAHQGGVLSTQVNISSNDPPKVIISQ